MELLAQDLHVEENDARDLRNVVSGPERRHRRQAEQEERREGDLVHVVEERTVGDRPRGRVVALEGVDDRAEHRRVEVPVVVHRPVEDAAEEVGEEHRGPDREGRHERRGGPPRRSGVRGRVRQHHGGERPDRHDRRALLRRHLRGVVLEPHLRGLADPLVSGGRGRRHRRRRRRRLLLILPDGSPQSGLILVERGRDTEPRARHGQQLRASRPESVFGLGSSTTQSEARGR
mmetsp:Transcript_8110/g.19906  ORF Transcript_8110/g.19906 Transcript_8110/m.19906 type:complete len:232 (+) Transcript_8110:445-1140(+)